MVRLSRPVFHPIIVIAAASLMAFGAAAQDRPASPRPTGSGGGLPVGSYRETCRGISLNGDRLRAQCIAQNGQSVATTLSVRSCNGARIRNDNGQLRCAAPVDASHPA